VELLGVVVDCRALVVPRRRESRECVPVLESRLRVALDAGVRLVTLRARLLECAAPLCDGIEGGDGGLDLLLHRVDEEVDVLLSEPRLVA
jgi:hypothetical protein